MAMRRKVFHLTGTTPAAAGQAAVAGMSQSELDKYDYFMIDALLVGATGGTLDVYIQRKLADDVWIDWAHFPQLAAAASAIKYTLTPQPSNGAVVVGKSTNAGAGAPALAVNTFIGGHPGSDVRVLAVAGASTSAGAAIELYISAFLGS